MTLIELSVQYRKNAETLLGRSMELKNVLQEEKLCEMRRLRLRQRIDALSCMYREASGTAFYLEHYYDGKQGARY